MTRFPVFVASGIVFTDDVRLCNGMGELGQVIDGAALTVTGLRDEVIVQSKLTGLKEA